MLNSIYNSIYNYIFPVEEHEVVDCAEETMDSTKLIGNTSLKGRTVWETRYEVRTQSTGGMYPSTYTYLAPVNTSRYIQETSTDFHKEKCKKNMLSLTMKDASKIILEDMTELYEKLKGNLPKKITINKHFSSITSIDVDDEKYIYMINIDAIVFKYWTYLWISVGAIFMSKMIYLEYKLDQKRWARYH